MAIDSGNFQENTVYFHRKFPGTLPRGRGGMEISALRYVNRIAAAHGFLKLRVGGVIKTWQDHRRCSLETQRACKWLLHVALTCS